MALALEGGLAQFNLESLAEAEMLSRVATALDRRAPVGFRVNPDVEAGTHAKITTGAAENKFGIAIADALAAYERISRLPGLEIQGIAVHIGSQLTDLAPLEAAFTQGRRADRGAARRRPRHRGRRSRRRPRRHLRPRLPPPPSPEDYGAMVRRMPRGWDARLVFEPGRLIVGNAGILLTRVIRVKPGAAHPFLIVDAAMNDLMRPALYDAWHAIEAVAPRGGRMIANVVGPVCEIRRHLRHRRARWTRSRPAT